MKDHESEEARKEMYRERHTLMENGMEFLLNNHGKSPDLYSTNAHMYLMEHGWELMFPLKKEEWPPDLDSGRYIKEMKWPGWTMYNYVMDVVAPPMISHLRLHFGYAVLEGKLVKCAFFITFRMVGYQIMPQTMVIDPLAVRDGKEPDFYIGCPVGKEDILNCLTMRKHPLEMYVARTEAEEQERDLDVAYMEAYCWQMATHPKLCPPELKEWAEGKRKRKIRDVSV